MKYTKKNAMEDAYEQGRKIGRISNGRCCEHSKYHFGGRCHYAFYRGFGFGKQERAMLQVMAGRTLEQPEIDAAFKTMES